MRGRRAAPTARCAATSSRRDAAARPSPGALISTDPPYYDNIGYSDLSDFFYVWLRRSLRSVYPDLLSTMLVPKAEELVANPYRHDGKDGAKEFFEDGFRRVFARARETALADYPITVYYAFKQSDAGDDGTASTGWETLLDGMIRSGWAITATWPMRSERGGRMRRVGTNALASSIVLALRPRPDDAPTTDRRGLIAALHDELPDALRKLQQGAIAPVDLPQAAIGPGMAVFSRYAKVIENDGTTMTVRSALARINEILDQVLNEQEGDFDAATRFAIAWYRQHGYATGKFGVADDLARARNTAVETMVRDGILTSAAGKVTLLSPANMPEGYDVLADDRVGAWEVLHHLIALLERDGLPVAGAFLASAQERPDGAIDIELVKELAFLLFSIAEKNGWTQDALAFNTVATAWPDDRAGGALDADRHGRAGRVRFRGGLIDGDLQPRPHRQDVRAARAAARRVHLALGRVEADRGRFVDGARAVEGRAEGCRRARSTTTSIRRCSCGCSPRTSRTTSRRAGIRSTTRSAGSGRGTARSCARRATTGRTTSPSATTTPTAASTPRSGCSSRSARRRSPTRSRRSAWACVA